MPDNIFNIPEQNLEDFQMAFNKLVKRAKKLNVEPPTMTVGESFIEEITTGEDELGVRLKIFRKYFPIEVEGSAPKIEGWSLCAKLEYFTETKNMIQSIPGFEAPEMYRERRCCDHCQTNRNRKHTFLVQHDDGRLLQVGRQCLKDFLGHKSPKALANYYSAIFEFLNNNDFEETQCGLKTPRLYSIGEILALGAACIRQYGWVSKKAAYMNESLVPTASTLKENLHSTPGIKIERPIQIVPQDYESVVKTTEWIEHQVGNSNYIQNLKMIVGEGFVNWDNIALLVSAIGCCQRDTEKQKLKKEQLASQHFGEIKERYDMLLQVLYSRTTESEWGIGTMVKFKDPEGNLFTWFSSNELDVEDGDVWKCKATVKAHKEYKGRKETLLTRVFCK